jgi:proline racemase
MMFKHIINAIDSHTAGEPTRIIIDGFPQVKGNTMTERVEYLREKMDWLRKSLMREPRGHRDMFGAILLPPIDSTADVAVIFMDGGRYYNMCGHASIGICAMLVETGRVDVMPLHTVVRLETPMGIVEGTVTIQPEGEVDVVSLVGVPSFAWVLDKKIDVPGHGELTVNVGFGGNFFVIVDSDQLGLENIDPQHMNELIKSGIAICKAANEQIFVKHPTKEKINTIDFCMITAPPSCPHADARNIVVIGKDQADRSPCGTGTCARMAVLHRKGLLPINQIFRHEGTTHSVFTGEIIAETFVGDLPAIIPKISCRPFLTGFHQFVIDYDDPFGEGFVI